MTQIIQRIILLLLLAGLIPVFSCKQMPYIPGEVDVIYLRGHDTHLIPGESSEIDVTGVKASGMAMPDGTLVQMIAESGTFLDLQGKKVEGLVLYGGVGRIIYKSDENFEGEVMNVTAKSGSALIQPEQLAFIVRVIDITQFYIQAQPPKLPPSGGTAVITVTAYDNTQAVVEGKKIFLETTAGVLSAPSPLTTGPDGKVTVNLETSEAATVTAKYKDITQSLLIDVGINQGPSASFVYSPTNPLMGETIYFTSTSSDPDGDIVSYQWQFGDGGSSNAENPSHNFPATAEPQEYNVVLIVTDDGGKTATDTKAIAFTVKETSEPNADFDFSPKNPDIGQMVTFTSLSTDEDGTIDQYYWDFGDGGVSSQQHPQYTYYPSEAQVYTVRLTVTDNDGKTHSTTKDVPVGDVDNQAPQANFSFTPEEPQIGQEILFLAQCTDDGEITSYNWDFGDGNSSTDQNPTHTYANTEPKSFAVTLEVVDDGGKTASVTHAVTFKEVENQLPDAVFTFSPQNPLSDNPVTFNASGSSDPDGEIVSYTWDFGDGHSGTGQNTTHTYSVTQTTTFTVSLTVEDDRGGRKTADAEITITFTENQVPTADFTYSPVSPTSGQTIYFDADPSNDPDGYIAQYTWDFGDGATGSGQYPNHTYNVTVETTFTVTLTVLDDAGALGTTSKQITVTPK